MAPITWSDVVAHDSTLSTIDPVQQADLLALANTFINPNMFGGEEAAKTRTARIYIAAHFAARPGTGQQGAAGAVVSESRGGLSRSYAAPPTDNGALPGWNETTWGRKYMALVRTSRARWPTVA